VVFAEFTRIGPICRYRTIAGLGFTLNLMKAEFMIALLLKRKSIFKNYLTAK